MPGGASKLEYLDYEVRTSIEEGDHFDGDLRNYDSLVQFIEEVTLSGGKPHTEHEDDIWDGL